MLSRIFFTSPLFKPRSSELVPKPRRTPRNDVSARGRRTSASGSRRIDQTISVAARRRPNFCSSGLPLALPLLGGGGGFPFPFAKLFNPSLAFEAALVASGNVSSACFTSGAAGLASSWLWPLPGIGGAFPSPSAELFGPSLSAEAAPVAACSVWFNSEAAGAALSWLLPLPGGGGAFPFPFAGLFGPSDSSEAAFAASGMASSA
mmetsp:Transcript_89064/g.163122  ORF Transcript_89064/g.163122 Transcript_89064/m.163122 type:complete len:205 (+) Transcript_89064:929-1543(+)